MKRAAWLLAAAVLASTCVREARAHEMRPGFFDLREHEPGVYSFLWKRPAGGESEIEINPVAPQGCSLPEREHAQLTPRAIEVRGTIHCEDGIRGKTIRIAGLESTFTDVLVRVRHADGGVETHLLKPFAPTAKLGAATSAWRRSAHYARLGVEHIMLGVDHLLFVLGLLLLVGDKWALVKTVTAFTVAHSLTLGAVTLGYASAPLPPLNAAIALSILFLAPEVLRRDRGETSLTVRHPWGVAFAFGLLHGFGFASGLATMGLPQAEVPLALLLFNVGVEMGQLAFVLSILMLVRAFRALEIVWPRAVELMPAYAIGTLGAYWTIARTLAMLGGTA